MAKRTFIEVTTFFDKPAVTNAVDEATRRVLSRFGAFVRRTARQSIRRPLMKRVADLTDAEKARYRKTGRRPKASAKRGKPPRNQTGKLKDNIFFTYNDVHQFVDIGPAKFPGFDRMGALEHGGMTKARGRMVRVEEHPFMGPAYKDEEPKLMDMWKDSIHG